MVRAFVDVDHSPTWVSEDIRRALEVVRTVQPLPPYLAVVLLVAYTVDIVQVAKVSVHLSLLEAQEAEFRPIQSEWQA